VETKSGRYDGCKNFYLSAAEVPREEDLERGEFFGGTIREGVSMSSGVGRRRVTQYRSENKKAKRRQPGIKGLRMPLLAEKKTNGGAGAPLTDTLVAHGLLATQREKWRRPKAGGGAIRGQRGQQPVIKTDGG